VGRNFANSVIKIRSASKYSSFSDFISRLVDVDLNKRTVEYLIKCGAFDSLGVTRSSLMNCYERIIDSEHDRSRNNIRGQMDLFSVQSSVSADYRYPEIEEYPLRELLLLEKESSGMYFSGHLIDGYQKHIKSEAVDSISLITEEQEIGSDVRYKDKSKVSIAGIITSARTKATRNGEIMAFLTVEDRYAEIPVVVFAKNYSKLSSILEEDSAVIISGEISREEGEGAKILLSSAKPLLTDSEFIAEKKVERRLYIKVSSLSDARIDKIRRTATLNSGDTKIVLYDESTGRYSAMKDLSIDPSDNVIARLKNYFGDQNVILK
jgi:DNA polymerase-3 subunit alpha